MNARVNGMSISLHTGQVESCLAAADSGILLVSGDIGSEVIPYYSGVAGHYRVKRDREVIAQGTITLVVTAGKPMRLQGPADIEALR